MTGGWTCASILGIALTGVTFGMAVFIAILVGVPAGIFAGLHRGTNIDRFAVLIATIGQALPNFWVAMMLIVPFALWWLYFCEEDNLSSEERNHIFLWGYGHYIIYASAAAIGAGFAALIDASGDHPHGDPNAALWFISAPIALYLFGLWFIRDRHIIHKKSAGLLLIFAALILLTPLLPVVMLPLATGLLVMALVFRLHGQRA